MSEEEVKLVEQKAKFDEQLKAKEAELQRINEELEAEKKKVTDAEKNQTNSERKLALQKELLDAQEAAGAKEEELKVKKNELKKLQSDVRDESKAGTSTSGSGTTSMVVNGTGNVQATMDKFVYAGDPQTLGQRWHEWVQMFDLYSQTNQMSNECSIKSSFLYHMGREALKIYGTLKNSDGSDTLDQIKKFMADHFEPYRSEYSEVSKFRRSVKRDGETVSEFVSRLRDTASYCRFDKVNNFTEKEIEWQFVIGCRMPELEKRMVE